MPILRQFRAVPNLLTLLRLFTVPFLVIAILDSHYSTAFALFVFAGLTDGFDGLIARWLHQQTELGLFMDPIADKLLLSTLFLVLTHVGLIPRYVTVLVFSRDLGLVLIGMLLFATHTLRQFRPTRFGKLNTCIQIFTLGLVMVDQLRKDHSLHGFSGVMLHVTAYCAVISAAEYMWLMLRRINAQTGTGNPASEG